MSITPRRLRRVTVAAVSIFLASLAGGSCARAQTSPQTPKPLPAPALLLAPLAQDQPIAVLPSTYVISDGNVTGIPATRAAQLAWVDSVIGEALQTRGPEAKWLLPAELRRVARRAPGVVSDPDQLGQATMRFEGLKKVPDPLFANLRSLSAMTNSRFMMIPAAVRFQPDGERCEGRGHARAGRCAERRHSVAQFTRRLVAPTAATALAEAIAWILPDLHPDMTYDITLIPELPDGVTAPRSPRSHAEGAPRRRTSHSPWDRQLGGMAAVAAAGDPLPEATLASIRRTRLALKGPLTTPVGGGFRSINVALRKEFQLFANVRPAKTIVHGGRFDGIDIVLVRENLEGLYIGPGTLQVEKRDGDPHAQAGESVAVVTRTGIRPRDPLRVRLRRRRSMAGRTSRWCTRQIFSSTPRDSSSILAARSRRSTKGASR